MGWVPVSETRHKYILVGSSPTWPRPASRSVPDLTSSLSVKVSEADSQPILVLCARLEGLLLNYLGAFGVCWSVFCPG
jgi:hypothetical protein